ncbi:MAG: hypothetical protein ACR2PL_21285 [Dehalococcoidia bacterium]
MPIADCLRYCTGNDLKEESAEGLVAALGPDNAMALPVDITDELEVELLVR